MNIFHTLDKKMVRELAFKAIAYIAIFAALIFILTRVDEQQLSHFVETAGPLGPLLLIIIVFAGAVFAPLSGGFILIFSTQLYHPFQAFAITYPAYLIGCICNYWIARRLGENFIKKLMGKETLNQINEWEEKITKNSWLLFILSPFGPDFVSYACGLLNIKFLQYLIAITIAVGINIGAYIFVGGSLVSVITHLFK
jgi:uncharacterized membrane protein YdjX (TVP38/TMEM64 family)